MPLPVITSPQRNSVTSGTIASGGRGRRRHKRGPARDPACGAFQQSLPEADPRSALDVLRTAGGVPTVIVGQMTPCYEPWALLAYLPHILLNLVASSEPPVASPAL